MHDIVIENARIVDGTGAPERSGTIAIRNGVIEKVTGPRSYESPEVIDAQGKIVAPGFIDVSNHSDVHLTLFSQPSLKSLLHQGITTIIGGNCGSSLAPLVDGKAIESIQKWGKIDQVNVNWLRMKEYLDVMVSKQLSVNYATMVGYSTVRRGFLKDEYRPLTEVELEGILQLVDHSLKAGALGVSMGLAFSHMQMADFHEIRQVAELIKKHNKVLSIHMRSDGERVIEALEEVIKITRATGVKTQISHIKILGRKNWKYFDMFTEILNEAIYSEGLPILFDVFPYTANNSVLYLLLPEWVMEGGKDAMLERLRDAELRERVIEDMKANNYDYARVMVSDAMIDRSILGKSIVEIAHNQGVSVEEALVNLTLASNGHARVITQAIHEDHLKYFIKHPYSIVGTDGIGYDDTFAAKGGFDHPRCYGAMTKYLEEYVLPGIVSLEEGIAKLTSLPAKQYGIRERGVIREGYVADLVVIDPTKVHSRANFSNPTVYSEGIEEVIIAGHKVVHNGQFLDAYYGGVLKY